MARSAWYALREFELTCRCCACAIGEDGATARGAGEDGCATVDPGRLNPLLLGATAAGGGELGRLGATAAGGGELGRLNPLLLGATAAGGGELGRLGATAAGGELGWLGAE